MKSSTGEIWRWSFYPSQFKVWIHPEYQRLRARIQGWKDTKKDATYFYPNGAIGTDLIIPARYYNRAARLLGLPLRKGNRTPKQIEHAKRLSQIGKKTLQGYRRTSKSDRITDSF